MLPLIPVEVWERVIDELSIHLTTLWSCALVCKAWQARSRFHLISRVTLTNRQQIYRLARLLDEHPELRTRVQTVHLRPEMLAGPMMHLTGFASMLAKKLPAVTSLWLFHSKWMPNTAQNNTFLHLSSFSSLLELSLRGVTFSSPLILARLICSFPNLGSVQLVEISVQNRVFDLLQLPTTLPPVRKIKLDGPSEDIADLLALHLGVAAGVEQFFGGWADFKEDVLSDSAIMTILRASGPTLQQVSLRLWGTPKTAAEQTEYADTDGAAALSLSSSLTLAPCTNLRTFYVCCCLLERQSKSGPWLYDLIASISSTELKGLVIDLDVRHIVDTDMSGFIKVSRSFWDEQQYAQMDELLADPARFKVLKGVAIRLLCGHRTQSPGDDTWRTSVSGGFKGMFPRLYSRGMLLGSLVVRLEYA